MNWLSNPQIIARTRVRNTSKGMKSFNGEPKRKARYLRQIIREGGLLNLSAAKAGISFGSDHRRWMASDPIYREAFIDAREEGEKAKFQFMFKHLCDCFRESPDGETEKWIQERLGPDALQTIKQGGYPVWQ